MECETLRSDVHLDHTPMSYCEMATLCETAATKAADTLGCSELKQEQMQVVTAVLQGRDVFAVLPTGYGKTLCYAVLPAAFDALSPGCSPSIVIVLSPLTAIMKDQASTYARQYTYIPI